MILLRCNWLGFLLESGGFGGISMEKSRFLVRLKFLCLELIF